LIHRLIYKETILIAATERYSAPVFSVGIVGSTGAVGVAGAVQPVSVVDQAEA